ncbi:MAG: hypothetical protein AB2L14_36240 [Candidatus Xenobiia bacterium LiM19]
MCPEDFVFRFNLENRERREQDSDVLAALTREQFANILDIIIPCYKGKRVCIDSFAFVNQPEKLFPLCDEKAADEKRE